MKLSTRFSSAVRPAGLHLVFSVVFVTLVAIVVFFVWYPHPYQEIAGGGKLFLLIASIDVICGPLMTLILYNKNKKFTELVLDLGFVAILQIGALAYGTWITWQARPLYLVLEVDRFKVISLFDIDHKALKLIPPNVAPLAFGGIRTVTVRPPRSVEEKNSVLLEALNSGRDYAERPDFYIPYEGKSALKSLDRAKSLEGFLERYPDQIEAANRLAKENSAKLNEWKYLPVVGRQEWVALLDKSGEIRGFLKGDGF